MKMFILGTIFGLIVSTVGFDGISKMLDKGVNAIKSTSESLAE